MSEADDLAKVFGYLRGVKNGKILTFHAFSDTHKLAAASKLQQLKARINRLIGKT